MRGIEYPPIWIGAFCGACCAAGCGAAGTEAFASMGELGKPGPGDVGAAATLAKMRSSNPAWAGA